MSAISTCNNKFEMFVTTALASVNKICISITRIQSNRLGSYIMEQKNIPGNESHEYHSTKNFEKFRESKNCVTTL